MEWELSKPPSDSISKLCFADDASDTSSLLVAGWDGSLSLYDALSDKLKLRTMLPASVLGCCFAADARLGFSACLDRVVRQHNFEVGISSSGINGSQSADQHSKDSQSSQSIIGTHDAGVSCVDFCKDTPQVVVSGSWDRTIKLWDVRAIEGKSENKPIPPSTSINVESKVFSMAVFGHEVIAALSNKKIAVIDLRKPDIAQESITLLDSGLKYQTRCVRTFPDRSGYVVTSIEGRAAVNYFDVDANAATTAATSATTTSLNDSQTTTGAATEVPSTANGDPNATATTTTTTTGNANVNATAIPAAAKKKKKKRFAFRCHRQGDKIFPVNAIAFHPTYGTFATGGSDGIVNIWDAGNKKNICELDPYPSGISSLSFNSDGSLLAVAASDSYENDGPTSTPPQPAKVFVRKVAEEEVQPVSIEEQ